MASDPKTRTTVRARVRVTLDIDTSDAWGGDCAMSQVVRQAKASAEGVLRRACANVKNVRLVGFEHVEVISTEENER